MPINDSMKTMVLEEWQILLENKSPKLHLMYEIIDSEHQQYADA